MNSRVLGALLIVLAVAILAHPLYLWPHYGETPYTVFDSPVDEAEVDGQIVEYGSLSPAERAALDGGSGYLYESEDAAVIETFERVDYVRRDGTVYRVSLVHFDDYWLLQSFARPPLSLLGGLLAVVGLRRLGLDAAGSRLSFVGGAAVGLGSLVMLDAYVSGSGSAAGLGVVQPVVALLVVVGAGALAGQALHRRDRRSALAIAALLQVVAFAAFGPLDFFGFATFVTVPLFVVVALIGVALGFLSRRDGDDGGSDGDDGREDDGSEDDGSEDDGSEDDGSDDPTAAV